MNTVSKRCAFYHLPGLFDFYDFYSIFLPIFYEHREYFYDWCDIASIYGAPKDCLWDGGRTGSGDISSQKVFSLMKRYKISSRFTFSNSLLTEEHLNDKRCNNLCRFFAQDSDIHNGIIVHSDILLNYLKQSYPQYYFVSSTTKVITDRFKLLCEIDNKDFMYVVPDFRINKDFDFLTSLSQTEKDKVEFLCNECCWISCKERKECYENVSKKNLGIDCAEHLCKAPNAENGYSFYRAKKNPAFISIDDIRNIYIPMGFTNFKIEGRNLGSAMLLEFILYYMTKEEYQLKVREDIYLDSMLDLF